MGIISRAGDLFYAFRFLKLLVTPFDKTEAFNQGIVDKDGKILKKSKELKHDKEKSAYTIFHRLVFNVKRLIQLVPGGKSTLGSYAAALFLIKEHTGMSDNKIEEVLGKALDGDLDNSITESTWFIKEGMLNPGVYCLTKDIVSYNTGEIIAQKNSKVKVDEHSDPYSSIFGHNIYEVKHVLTKQNLYISNEDIKR